jgi:anaerobic selenocysteine-containing dehydrogenase
MNAAYDPLDPRMQGMHPSELPTETALAMKVDGAEPVLFRNVFPNTPSGKIELWSDALERCYGQGLPGFREIHSDYPLALISPSSDKRTTSTFGGVSASDATPVLEMHPDDAAARGLVDGLRVKVWNDLGEVHLPLKITAAVRPGVVYSVKGAWFRTSDNGQTVSALAPLHKADLAEGACFNDARVEVAALQ